MKKRIIRSILFASGIGVLFFSLFFTIFLPNFSMEHRYQEIDYTRRTGTKYLITSDPVPLRDPPSPVLEMRMPQNMKISQSESVELTFNPHTHIASLRILFKIGLAEEDSISKLVKIIDNIYEDIARGNYKVGATLEAPNFDITPHETIFKKINSEETRWVWIIKPKSTGNHKLLIRFVDFPHLVFSHLEWSKNSYLIGNRINENTEHIEVIKNPQTFEIKS